MAFLRRPGGVFAPLTQDQELAPVEEQEQPGTMYPGGSPTFQENTGVTVPPPSGGSFDGLNKELSGLTVPYGMPDPSTWDVDSYGVPQYLAQNFGNAPSGWDPAKWSDPTHQTPKYVWGRIYQEAQASGDPNWQQQAVERFMQAYPGTQYGGKDVVWTPWGEEVDLFRDYGGENGVSWGVAGAPSDGGGFDLNALLAQMGNRSALGASSAAPSGGGVGGGGNEFADPAFQSVIESIGAAHPQWAEYQAWKAGQGAGGGSAAGGSSMTNPRAPEGGMQALYDVLGRMFDKNAEYNEGILNRRVESARESMNRARGSQSDYLRGQLAERGLLGSGAETTAMTGLEEQLGDIYGGQVRDIYADESARSDQRLLETMAIAAGLSGQDASRLVDWFNARAGRDIGMGQIAATNRRTDADAAAEAGRLGLGYGQLDLDRMLGTGRLGLENIGLQNTYNLGLGRLNLDRDLGEGQLQRGNLQDYLEIIRLMNPNAYQNIPGQYR